MLYDTFAEETAATPRSLHAFSPPPTYENWPSVIHKLPLTDPAGSVSEGGVPACNWCLGERLFCICTI